MVKIDNLDKRILYELDCDCRQNYSKLAKKLRSSKTTVKYRVERLVKEGVITQFHTIIDFSKIGYSIFRFYIRLKNCSPAKEKQIIEYLINKEKVFVFYKVNGPYSLVLGIKAKDVWELKDFWDSFYNNFFDYIQKTQFSIIHNYMEFSRDYLIPEKYRKKKQFITLKNAKKVKTMEFDEKLLNYISFNARASLIELSNHFKKTPISIKKHLKFLENSGVIAGYRINLDLEKLQFQYYKVDLFFSSNKNLEQIKTYVLSNPHVLFSESSVVGSDFEFDLEVNDFKQFNEIMDDLKTKFPKDIADYNYYSLIKTYKIF